MIPFEVVNHRLGIRRCANPANKFADKAVKSIGKVNEKHSSTEPMVVSNTTKSAESLGGKPNLLVLETANLARWFDSLNQLDCTSSQECMYTLGNCRQKHDASEMPGL